jgi:hypothetical protein
VCLLKEGFWHAKQGHTCDLHVIHVITLNHCALGGQESVKHYAPCVMCSPHTLSVFNLSIVHLLIYHTNSWTKTGKG